MTRIFAFTLLVTLSAACGSISSISQIRTVSIENDLATAAKAAFKKNCAQCHGPSSTGEGGINYITDLEALVSNGKVNRGTKAQQKKSRVLVRMKSSDDPMPPLTDDQGEDVARPSKADVAAIENWILANAPVDDAPAPLRTVSREAIEEAILADLSATTADKNLRYLTLEHLYNQGKTTAELNMVRLNLTRIVNSLTWSKGITVLEAIGPKKLVLKIDLRDFEWDAEQWSAVEKANPYERPDSKTLKAIRKATGTKQPLLRADMFANETTKPPLYYTMLAPSEDTDFPEDVAELEELLGVDVAENMRATVEDDVQSVMRMGIPENQSGVSFNNRMIERHEIEDGAYWKSYDFGAPVKSSKILNDCPLGPGDIDEVYAACGQRHFVQDGGEMIWSLPNGMQAYFVVDAAGDRLNAAPTDIVLDRSSIVRNFVGATPGQISPGISCMACHNEGIRPGVDKVRDVALAENSKFSEKVKGFIANFYTTKTANEKVFAADRARFAKALQKTGKGASTEENIVGVVAQYGTPVTLEVAAAEFYMTPAEFTEMAKKLPHALQAQIANLLHDGTLGRYAFAKAYPKIAAEISGNGEEPIDEDDDEEVVEEDDDSNIGGGKCTEKFKSFRFIPLDAKKRTARINKMHLRIGKAEYAAEQYAFNTRIESTPRSVALMPTKNRDRLKTYVVDVAISSDTDRGALPLHHIYSWKPKKFMSKDGELEDEEFFQVIFPEPVLLTGVSFEHDTLKAFKIVGIKGLNQTTLVETEVEADVEFRKKFKGCD